jgi:hypothetical protein
LGGWWASNDVEKLKRWEETAAWAENNGCTELIGEIPDHDFYCVDNPTSYEVGPMGGPMYREWDFDTKERPGSEKLTHHMEALRSRWPEIVGHELGRFSRPVSFTGKKARRLLVSVDGVAKPPWGGWAHLSAKEEERRTFTRFRAAINEAIAPHEIDHVDFTTEEDADHQVLGN